MPHPTPEHWPWEPHTILLISSLAPQGSVNNWLDQKAQFQIVLTCCAATTDAGAWRVPQVSLLVLPQAACSGVSSLVLSGNCFLTHQLVTPTGEHDLSASRIGYAYISVLPLIWITGWWRMWVGPCLGPHFFPYAMLPCPACTLGIDVFPVSGVEGWQFRLWP